MVSHFAAEAAAYGTETLERIGGKMPSKGPESAIRLREAAAKFARRLDRAGKGTKLLVVGRLSLPSLNPGLLRAGQSSVVRMAIVVVVGQA